MPEKYKDIEDQVMPPTVGCSGGSGRGFYSDPCPQQNPVRREYWTLADIWNLHEACSIVHELEPLQDLSSPGQLREEKDLYKLAVRSIDSKGLDFSFKISCGDYTGSPMSFLCWMKSKGMNIPDPLCHLRPDTESSLELQPKPKADGRSDRWARQREQILIAGFHMLRWHQDECKDGRGGLSGAGIANAVEQNYHKFWKKMSEPPMSTKSMANIFNKALGGNNAPPILDDLPD